MRLKTAFFFSVLSSAVVGLGLACSSATPEPERTATSSASIVSCASYLPLGLPAANGSPALVARSPGVLDVMYMGPGGANGSLRHRSLSGANGTWSTEENLGGTIYAKPAVSAWGYPTGGNTLDTFVMGGNGGLYHNHWDGTLHTATWDGPLAWTKSAPAVSAWGPSHVNLFYVGSDNALKHRWYTPGVGYSAEESFAANLVGDPTAVSSTPNQIDVFARNHDNQLYHLAYNNGWGAPEMLGGTLASSPSVTSASPGTLDVFWAGTNGTLHHRAFGTSGWQPEEDLGAYLMGDPAAASAALNRVDVVYTGLNGQLVRSSWATADSALTQECWAAGAPPGVLTQRNDRARTGANLREVTLNTSNVNAKQFGQLFSWKVDGNVYAQPLYVPGVRVQGQGTHDLVIVATEHNYVYAFDAQATYASPWLWRTGSPATGNSPATADLGPPLVPTPPVAGGRGNIWPEMGVTGTPVVDPATNTLYVVAATSDATGPVFQIHAIDVRTGAHAAIPNNPSTIHASVNTVVPTTPTFNFVATPYVQHAGLALGASDVFVAFSSNFGDDDVVGSPWEYRGWMMGFSKQTLALTSAFLDTAQDYAGGIWQGGAAPAVDEKDDVFFMTGNPRNGAATSFGDSMVELRPATAGQYGNRDMASFFTPSNAAQLTNGDMDFGSSGPILHPPWVIGGGKDGYLYVTRIDALGGRASAGGIDNVVQRIPTGGYIFGPPTVWPSATGSSDKLYIWPGNGYLQSFYFNSDNRLARQATGSRWAPDSKGAYLAISSQGGAPSNGILWANVVQTWDTSTMLAAYDAADVTHELWTSAQLSGDAVPGSGRFATPTVAGGRVFLGSLDWQYTLATQPVGHVTVYGLRNSIPPDSGAPPPPPPPICPGPCAYAGPPTWTAVYNTYFALSGTNQQRTEGHCAQCHLQGPQNVTGFSIAPDPANPGDTTAANFYGALTGQTVRFQDGSYGPLVTPGVGVASASALGDPARTPLAWYCTHAPMPYDMAIPDSCAAAAVTAWLQAGAPAQ